MTLSHSDKTAAIEFYRSRYQRFGYSPKSLGWDKGKQDIRFQILTSFFTCAGKRILDIGCGFGDLNTTLRHTCGDDYAYLGIDLVSEFIMEAQKRYAATNMRFMAGNFLEFDFTERFDLIFASGIFNNKQEETNQYEYISDVMQKSFMLADEGLCFDFLSDKVDYTHTHTFHSSPEKILSIAYSLSRNVILQNNYFPFEFTICVFKDDSFSVEDTIFNRWKTTRSLE